MALSDLTAFQHRGTATLERIEISHHTLPVDPAFPAAWDSQPRTRFPVCLVRAIDSEGREGVGSGGPMYGFDDFQHLFIGQDPLDLERHSQVLANIDFHAGRCWPLEIALWDLAGKIQERPVYQLLGGASNRLSAYASTGVHREPQAAAAQAESIRAAGFRALKLRFGRASLADDFDVLALVRRTLGEDFVLMVDCNQGWRMPQDTQPAWGYAQAREVAEELIRYGVYWMEEPLHRGDYAGMERLNAETGDKLKLAGGEMTREGHTFREMRERCCLDVYQPDAACTQGLLGLAWLAQETRGTGALFSPHTWGDGIGLLANLHLAAGTVGMSGCPFLEYPFDPPEWDTSVRDYPLAEPVVTDAEGMLTLSDAPGLGVELNEARLAATTCIGLSG